MAEQSTYKVVESRVEGLFASGSVAFEVPMFQRRFAWGAEEVEELLDDLYGNEEWLSKSGETLPYFLGSVVLTKGPDADYVLDGQQRLTTVSLILAVFKHQLKKAGYAEADKINVFLEAGKLGQKQTPKIKLQPEDALIYARLYKNPDECNEPELKKSRLAGAVRAIMSSVDDYARKLADSQHQSLIESLEQMASRLIYEVEFVRITAPSEAAAFRLFETLNDRGLDLSAADLVKNKLFAQCGPAYLPDVRVKWKDATDAVGESELVNFLRNFLISRGTPVRKNDLYDVLRDQIAAMKAPAVDDFAGQVRTAALLYRGLMSPSLATGWNSDTVESLKRLNTFRAKSSRPALLACAQVNPGGFASLVRAVEIVAVRYSIVGQLKPVVLEKAYAQMCKTLRDDPSDVAGAIRVLGRDVPRDEDFRAVFARLDTDNITPSWRELLIGLNNSIASGETRVLGPDKVHVEHILPRNPSKAALIESSLTVEEANELAGRIGNLTLLSGTKNQSISNKAFSQKQPVFEASEIALNTSIATHTTWGRDEIEGRSNELADLAIQTWPWVFA